jgi:HK97 family phage major capsid protein
MEKEELKAILDVQFKAFKESLPSFVDEAGMTKALADFKNDISKELGEAVKAADFKTLEEAVKAQGIILQANSLKADAQVKSFAKLFAEKASEVKAMVENGGSGKVLIPTTLKAIQSTSVTSDTMAYRSAGVGEIKRGMPFMRDLFQVVNLTSDSHGTVKWYEQLAVTDNAKNVAETRVVGAESNLTWVEKTLTGKRLFDHIKVGVDQLKDVAFIAGEVQRLVERNMRLKENSQLINGVGTGNEIAGILSYAVEFVTTDISVQDANFVDLVGLAKTQIDTTMLGGATPNITVTNRKVTDLIRYKKDAQNRYINEGLAFGNDLVIGGIQTIENPLMSDNTALIGDFSLATLYVFDDLMIEIAQIEDDKKTGMTTIMAYMRENLRVQDVDVNAFVKVSDVATTLSTITTPVA